MIVLIMTIIYRVGCRPSPVTGIVPWLQPLFYEDRRVAGVDVDCGADLDSDTNINSVASFIQ